VQELDDRLKQPGPYFISVVRVNDVAHYQIDTKIRWSHIDRRRSRKGLYRGTLRYALPFLFRKRRIRLGLLAY